MQLSGTHDRRSAQKLTRQELGAWLGFLRAHATLIHQLDDELRAAHALPLSSYDVLTQLDHGPDEGMRMSALADAVTLSRSGLTRLVDRLTRDGLVERRPCADDARGSLAALTPAGKKALDQARGTHLEGVRRLFLKRIGPADQKRLAGIWAELS